jgi:hypothetical protein
MSVRGAREVTDSVASLGRHRIAAWPTAIAIFRCARACDCAGAGPAERDGIWNSVFLVSPVARGCHDTHVRLQLSGSDAGVFTRRLS